MHYLLDTHILLWWLSDSKKIKPKARKIIEDAENIVFVSSAAIWEMAIKERLGRLSLPRNLLRVILSESFSLLPISAEEALLTTDLPNIHQDPFDRIMVAQAKYHDLTLITRDNLIPKYPIDCLAG